MSSPDWIKEAREYPLKRGLTYDDLARHHCLLVEHPSVEQLQSWLGMPVDPTPEAVWVFPNLFTDNGDTVIYNRALRLFPPNGDRKFLTTKDIPGRPYILLDTPAVAPHLDVPLLICEKQIVAILVRKLGFHAIALGGTFEAAEKRAQGEKVRLHPVLKQYAWSGRTVWLSFDSDYARREGVLQGLIRTFLLLVAEGAIPKLLKWDSASTGLDDFLASKSTNDLELQKRAFEELLLPLADIDLKAAAAAWITPSMLKFFEREGAIVEMSSAVRNQLAHLLAKPLDVSVGSLEKAWGAKEFVGAQVPDGTLPIPEPWSEPVDSSALLDELLGEFLNPRFIVITEPQAIVCALYSVSTYLTDYIDDNLPFLYVTVGAKESGKTKLLELFFELVYHPDLSGNPSAASIYFALKEGVYTILIDEVDRNEAHREAVLDLLNFSHSRRTAWVSRGNPEKGARVKYPTFCPKIIGGNGSIRDTSNSRCIRIQMLRKGPGTPRIRITRKDRTRFAIHRSKMMRLARELGPKLHEFDWDGFQLPADLYNREADNWLLLFVIADLVGGEWPKLVKYAHWELCPPKTQDEVDDINTEGLDVAALGEALIRDVARIWRHLPWSSTQVTSSGRNSRL
jgi:hypothetical protein